MGIFLFITLIFILAVLILAGALFLRAAKTAAELARAKTCIKNAINKINHARYGNFRIKFKTDEDFMGLYGSLNNLFESVTDRDLVINEYREKEKESYNLKEEFIAALTHDLKVPIIAQDKTFDLLIGKKFGALTPVQKDVILKLKESNSDLKEMVNSILETYKIENKGIELRAETVDVNGFLISAAEGLQNFANSSGKKINLFLPKESLTAEFDPLLIKRVINNLVANALHHSKTTDKIDIHLNKTGDTFSIDVIDYGEGIDEEEIKKIFNKYYSITGKARRVSTGLGLYLSNKIVKKHKGVIEVESKKGEGSIFRIILPVKSV